MNKVILLTLLLFAGLFQTMAQVFVGSGYAEMGDYGSSALDEGRGFTLLIEKDVRLSSSGRLQMHPGINVSFIHTQLDRETFPFYLNVLSLSPKVSYEFISKERFKVAPFATVFGSYLMGIESVDILSSSTSERIDRYHWGIESGIRADFQIKGMWVRLIPFSVQKSLRNAYRQGMISLMVRL